MIRNAAAMPPCRVWPGSIGRRSRGEGERSPLLFPCARRGKEGGKSAPVSGRGKPPRGNAVSTCRMVSQRLRTNEVFLVDTREREEKRKRNTMTTTLQHLVLEKSLSLSRSFYLHVNRVIVQVRERMRNKRKEKFALDCYIIVPFTRFPGSFFLKEEQHWLADPPPPPPSIRFDRLRRR